MRRAHASLTVRRLMVVVAIVAVLLVALIVPVGRRYEYEKLRREMNDSIDALQYRVPQGVGPRVWECAWGWTLTAYGNVCFSEEHVRIEEMYRLRDELVGRQS
jgi:hypothetical protein